MVKRRNLTSGDPQLIRASPRAPTLPPCRPIDKGAMPFPANPLLGT